MRFILILAIMAALPVLAQAPPDRDARRPAGDRFLESLREKDPDAFAELQRLRKEDPQAFRREIRKRFGTQNRPQGRPAPDRGTDRPPAPPDGRRGPRNEEFMQRLFERLEERHPERAAELKRLHQEDPEAFRLEVRELLMKKRPLRPQPEHGRSGGPSPEKLQRLRQRLQDADTPEKQAAAREEIRELLAKHYDSEVNKQQERLDIMAKQIDLMRERLAERRENRDRLLEEQLEKIVED